MKYYVILLVNCLLVYCIILFFADHKFIPEGIAAKIRNLVLVCLFFTICYNLVSIYVLKKNAPETGLVNRTASGVKNSAGNFIAYIKPFKKELIVYSLVAAGIIVISLVFVGIPRAFLLQVPVKLGISKPITGDSAWPAAILLSILWPLCLPAGVFIKNWLMVNNYTSVSSIAPLLTTVIGIPLMTALVYAVSK